MATRIVLLHATPIAMQPIQLAFSQRWADAEIVNLLDDGLTIDRAREDDLSSKMIDRFVSLGKYAHGIGADGILVTCSAFGAAIDQLAKSVPVPVIKPNEAMFQAAVAYGLRIGMLATFGPSVPTMTHEFDEFVASQNRNAELRTVLVDRAIDLLRAGDAEAHNTLVAARAPELADCDAIMLAHFSTSRAASLVRAAVDKPILTAPDAAVDLMKRLVTGIDRASSP
jgi:Asp/Glu/hydantoin racemase